MICGYGTENEIKFIKGDVFEVYFVVTDVELDCISRVVFSCQAGKILCDLPYSEEREAFCLRFNSQMSDAIRPGFYTYDVTLELLGGSKITLLHNEDFVVLKKRNTLNEDAYVEDDNNGGEDVGGGDNNESGEPTTTPDENNKEEGGESDGKEESKEPSEEVDGDGNPTKSPDDVEEVT